MRTKTGIVLASKMDKTVIVRVESAKADAKYKKLVRTAKKFYAHDPEKKYKEGDTITIYETRPLSKLKRWTVIAPVKSSQHT